MKQCSQCKQLKPFSEFNKDRNRHDGFQSYCKNCDSKYQKKYNQTKQGKESLYKRMRCYRQTEKSKATNRRGGKRYYIQHPERCKAHSAVSYAIKSGQLPRPDTLQCHYCPNQAQEYHHPSYAPKYKLNVLPVCRKCHQENHRRIA